MRVALIGGTGFGGSAVLAELLARKHEVTAIVRRSDADVPDGAKVVEVDVLETAALQQVLTGLDAVVSAYNPGWQDPDLYDDFMRGSRSIQRAATDAGVPRLLVVGGSASLLTPEGTKLYDTMEMPENYKPGVRAAMDYLDELRSARDIDWVYLSPPPNYSPAGPQGRRDEYRTGTDHPVTDASGKSEISREDLAVALVDELEKPRVHQARFTVGY